ncbi:hypothetical protein MRB53_009060 [Persea americana]|uniref:Uncharacterized protein n=1 Tax=Persea americana TaxID=3435 RepID=A0ACC2LN33_PERAE|nr:hypothetical protein MRB53_009060 [Persea americana]|eukprot:TRINITY_DN1662_c0_g1_i1.p1 TRINITY_DN1662_c0_g1~~TRINITY_DN1662_c0_g1_i1.p1  ORF type:complete len:379 (-),score=70.85 TRINITY_DN1662_c0_g1_i1:732-1868(-)
MSGAPRVRSLNVADAETRPVLGPAGNKTGSIVARKPVSKPSRKVEKAAEAAVTAEEKKKAPPPAAAAVASSPPSCLSVPSVLRRQEQLLHSNLSLNGSCSSDASSDSVQSRASTGRIMRTSSGRRRKQCVSKSEKAGSDSVSVSSQEGVQTKKRCAWVTSNTEPCYAAFHDEEWGVPVHDDKKLFELLVLSGALAELSWRAILSKRHIFREVFLDFDPASVAKLNEKKIIATGSTASSLLSEPKLRAVVENARQILKIIEEFGSFDQYCWSFVNHKPILNRFRYPRQVPVKTPKADVISKDMVRRGFRCVGPTVIYSFMQITGMTNDHLIGCYRFEECIATLTQDQDDAGKAKVKVEEEKSEDLDIPGLGRDMDELVI